MRVISGKAKGRKLDPVPGDSTRPIMDRVKTALFDTIRPRIQGIEMLDLFAGAGSVGIEALSQGAARCIFTEINKKAIDTIKDNLRQTDLSKQAQVWHTDAFKYLKNSRESYDLIYVAPPQFKNMWVEAVHIIAERPELIKEGGEIIVQIDPTEYEELSLVHFQKTSERKYGNTLLIFYDKSTKA